MPFTSINVVVARVPIHGPTEVFTDQLVSKIEVPFLIISIVAVGQEDVFVMQMRIQTFSFPSRVYKPPFVVPLPQVVFFRGAASPIRTLLHSYVNNVFTPLRRIQTEVSLPRRVNLHPFVRLHHEWWSFGFGAIKSICPSTATILNVFGVATGISGSSTFTRRQLDIFTFSERISDRTTRAILHGKICFVFCFGPFSTFSQCIFTHFSFLKIRFPRF